MSTMFYDFQYDFTMCLVILKRFCSNSLKVSNFWIIKCGNGDVCLLIFELIILLCISKLEFRNTLNNNDSITFTCK